MTRALKDAIASILANPRDKRKPWMTATGIGDKLPQTISQEEVQELLLEMEQDEHFNIRRSRLPSIKNLDILWGHTDLVKKLTTHPAYKTDEAEVYFSDSEFSQLSENAPLAFVSHSHSDDEEDLKAIGRGLMALNIRPWYSQTDIMINQIINDAIQDSLGNSDYFVLYLTQNAAGSDWVMKEFSTNRPNFMTSLSPVIIISHTFSKDLDEMLQGNYEGYDQVPQPFLRYLHENKRVVILNGTARNDDDYAVLKPTSLKELTRKECS